MFMQTLGERLKFLMKEKDIGQTPLSELLDVSQAAISKILNNKVEQSGLIVRLCKIFDANPFWLDLGEGVPYPREGRVPEIPWHQIPNVSKDVELLTKNYIHLLDITFKNEVDLFATKIPDIIVPGKTSDGFSPGDLLLISPKRAPDPKKYVVIYKKGWPAPEYAQFFYQEGLPHLRYPGKEILTEITDDIRICGVVVSRMNIFI